MLVAGTMHKFIPAGVVGEAKIVHDSPDPLTRARAWRDGQPLNASVYCRLFVGNRLWMTDADFEARTNWEAVSHATGDVFLGGLGLGFMIRPILKNKDVKSVTIIELSKDVITMISPTLPKKKITVIHADARSWNPPKDAFDMIYMDIWANVPNSDDKADLRSVRKRYRNALREGGWYGAWCERHAMRS